MWERKYKEEGDREGRIVIEECKKKKEDGKKAEKVEAAKEKQCGRKKRVEKVQEN